jgi:hypothetical protein
MYDQVTVQPNGKKVTKSVRMHVPLPVIAIMQEYLAYGSAKVTFDKQQRPTYHPELSGGFYGPTAGPPRYAAHRFSSKGATKDEILQKTESQLQHLKEEDLKLKTAAVCLGCRNTRCDKGDIPGRHEFVPEKGHYVDLEQPDDDGEFGVCDRHHGKYFCEEHYWETARRQNQDATWDEPEDIYRLGEDDPDADAEIARHEEREKNGKEEKKEKVEPKKVSIAKLFKEWKGTPADTPDYSPMSPQYSPSSPSYSPKSPPYSPTEPAFDPTEPAYDPLDPKSSAYDTPMIMNDAYGGGGGGAGAGGGGGAAMPLAADAVEEAEIAAAMAASVTDQ